MVDKIIKVIEYDDGTKYQIAAMTPFDASYAYTRVLTKAIPLIMAQLAENNGSTVADLEKVNYLEVLPLLIERLSEEEMNKIQSLCLNVCRQVDAIGVGLPIYSRKLNQFLIEIEPPVLWNLTIASLIANVAPFFSGEALKGLFQGFSTSNQLMPTL